MNASAYFALDVLKIRGVFQTFALLGCCRIPRQTFTQLGMHGRPDAPSALYLE